jgi:predicted nucleic acid-binding protein
VLVVADAGPIIALSSVDLLELLPKLFETIVVPREVHDEVVGRGAGLPGSRELAAAKWAAIQDVPPDDSLLTSLRETLDAGEAAALAFAAHARADLILIDELRGRQTARKMGLAIKDTLGVLVSAKRSGLIDAICPVLDALVARDFWLADDLRARLLAEVGE